MKNEEILKEILSMIDDCTHCMINAENIPIAVHRQKLIEMHARCVKLQKENPWMPEVPDFACETRN